MNRYEAVFIVDQDLGDAGVEKVLEQVQKEIRDVGGQIGEVDNVGKRSLAHVIRKRSHGYYSVIEFEGEGSAIEQLLARYRLTEGLLRANIMRAREKKPAEIEPDGDAEAEAPAETAAPLPAEAPPAAVEKGPGDGESE